MIDEIQSDPYEYLTKHRKDLISSTPELKEPHGDMAKALLLQASQAGADRMMIPDAKLITSVRDQSLYPAFQNIYDDQLGKQFYEPLDTLGVKVFNGPTGYRSVELNPEVRDNLNKFGLPFKQGGLSSCRCNKTRAA
jgi:hypothetical protein